MYAHDANLLTLDGRPIDEVLDRFHHTYNLRGIIMHNSLVELPQAKGPNGPFLTIGPTNAAFHPRHSDLGHL
jgi:hypothetical protein